LCTILAADEKDFWRRPAVFVPPRKLQPGTIN